MDPGFASPEELFGCPCPQPPRFRKLPHSQYAVSARYFSTGAQGRVNPDQLDADAGKPSQAPFAGAKKSTLLSLTLKPALMALNTVSGSYWAGFSLAYVPNPSRGI